MKDERLASLRQMIHAMAVDIALYELRRAIAISAAPRYPSLNICAKEFLMGGTTEQRFG